MPASLKDLALVFEMAGGDHYGEEAYIHLGTGEIFVISEAAGIREGPEGMEESEEFIAVPSKRDLRLGRDLVLSFVDKEAPTNWKSSRTFSAGKALTVASSSGCMRRGRSMPGTPSKRRQPSRRCANGAKKTKLRWLTTRQAA